MAQIASFKKGKFKIYVEFLYERAPNSPRLCKKQKRGNVFKIPPQINDANCSETLSQPTLKNPSFTVKPTKERPKVQNITCKKPLQIQKLFRFYIQKNYSTLLFLRI